MRKTLASPTFRRAFSLAILLHVLVFGLGALFVRCWTVCRIMPVPAGLVLDVAEPLSSGIIPEEFSGLERALAVMPPESREMPAQKVPGIAPATPPLLPVITPERTAFFTPLVPAVGWMVNGERKTPGTAQGPGLAAGASPAKSDAPDGEGAGNGGRPIALSEIRPHYPYGARARGEAGRVVVAVRVKEDGAVESVEIKVSSGYMALDASAVAATKRARFRPGEAHGRPVPSSMNLQFEFRLEER